MPPHLQTEEHKVILYMVIFVVLSLGAVAADDLN